MEEVLAAEGDAVRPASESPGIAPDEPSFRRRTASFGRYLGARAVVAMADYLPRPASETVIGGLAFAECALTRAGRARRAEGRIAFGLGKRASWRTAWKTFKVPLQDLVDLRRISTGRDTIEQWSVEEVNPEVLHDLLDAGEAFLIAGGHFAYAPFLPLTRTVPDVLVTGAVEPIEPFQWDGDVLLRRLQRGMLHGLASVLRPETGSLAYVGKVDVQAQILSVLEQHGGVGYVAIDTYWRKASAYFRPFCGEARWPFATGAARISRLAQVPTIIAVSERTGLRSSRIHYFGPFAPMPIDAVDRDLERMDELIEVLERLIGEMRDHYPNHVGWDRRWDASRRRWQGP